MDNFEIINLVDTYDQLRSSREVKISEHNLEITKSQYRPKLGFAARFTQYDLDDEAEDQDIRGGFYVNFPVFSFGRGSAQVGAGKAKVQQAKINKGGNPPHQDINPFRRLSTQITQHQNIQQEDIDHDAITGPI